MPNIAPGIRRTVAFTFTTPKGRAFAENWIREHIHADAYIIAPPDLLSVDWVESATRYCRSWDMHYLRDEKLDNPIETLAHLNKIWVFADENFSGDNRLKLVDSLQIFVWLAITLGVDVIYCDTDGFASGIPESFMTRQDILDRVNAQKQSRINFMRQLTEIRLWCDFYSSGLWNEKGQMLDYDLLDLPFPLVRRIAAWQRNYNETVNPPNMPDEAWWAHHRKELILLAKELQETLGPEIRVIVFSGDGWAPISEVEN